MKVHHSETTPTPAHAVKCGDRIREKRTGEVREVVVMGDIVNRRLHFDDGTWVEAGVLDTVFVTQEPVTPKGTKE